ncbi:MAG: metalloregulator ArsR/SmtB family transcription factor [Actinomycetota bacterium]
MEAQELSCCSIVSAGIDEDAATQAAAVFKALADPARVRIVNILATSARPVCVCELIPELGLSQGTVSFHIKKLMSAGLLEREQRGTWAFYTLQSDVLVRIAGIFTPEGGHA